MARAHFVKRARKCPRRGSGIYRGDSYWWWKFKRRPKQLSKTRPTRAQLTRSPFLAAIYRLEDGIAGIKSGQEAEDYVEAMKEEIESLRANCEESLEALPENFKAGSTAELIQERFDALGEWLNNLESLDFTEHIETEPDEDGDDAEMVGGVDIADVVQAIQDCSPGSF